MARKTETVTTVTDDLTGEELDPRTRPTEFTYKRRTYSLDLGRESVERFEEALKPFISVATPVVESAPNRPERTPAAPRKRSRSANQQTAAVRAWAVERGLVAEGSRGRISREVQAAYDEAHG